MKTHEKFEKVVLVHGCSEAKELAYQERICNELPASEWFEGLVADKLAYFPTVTCETFRNQGRIPALVESNELFEKHDLPVLDIEHDRFMLCGSPVMLEEMQVLSESRGFTEDNMSHPGHYMIERAFVEK